MQPFWTLLGATAISGLVGVGVWLIIRRPIDLSSRRQDKLEDEVHDLREDRVTRIESDIERAGTKRGKMHNQIGEIRETFVEKKDCKEFRATMTTQIAHFNGSVLKLERIGVRVEIAVKDQQAAAEQLAAIQIDIAKATTRIEALNGKSHR